MDENPIKSLDTQIASKINDVRQSILSSYKTTPNNLGVNATKVTALSYRMPQEDLPEMPQICNNSDIDWLNSDNNLDVNKNIKSLSLDPIIKRLLQEKQNILRDIEGWVASQASDGARQSILANSIVKWVKLAISYMRCGVKLVNKIVKLINDLLTAIITLIQEITALIASTERAIASLQRQMNNLKSELEKEGVRLAIIAAMNFLQDEIALYNEIGAMRKELLTLKAACSISHMKGQFESSLNQMLSLLHSFEHKVNTKLRLQRFLVQLQSAQVRLEETLVQANNIDLTFPMNPGGTNPGGLYNFSVTNDPDLFEDYDSLTNNNLLARLDKTATDTNAYGLSSLNWGTIFSSSETGLIVFSSNTFGAFQVGVAHNMQQLCPNSSFALRLSLNGGAWVIETKISGHVSEQDDPTVSNYSTKQGIFTSVPAAPNISLELNVTFDDFIRASNRPNWVNNYSHYIDPYTGSIIAIPTTSTSFILVPGSIPSSPAPLETASDLTITQANWINYSQNIKRFYNQTEIDVAENSYSQICRTLGISPHLFVNPFNDPTNGLYNPSSPKASWDALPISLPSRTILLDADAPSTDVSIIRFKMPYDNQLKASLIGKKPFSGLQIFVNSIEFQINSMYFFTTNIPHFYASNGTVVSFGLKADWGFAPLSQLS